MDGERLQCKGFKTTLPYIVHCWGVPGLVSGSRVVQYLIHNNCCTVNMCRVQSVRVYVSVNNSIIHSAVDSPLLLLCLGSYKEHNIKNVESSSPQSKQNSLRV